MATGVRLAVGVGRGVDIGVGVAVGVVAGVAVAVGLLLDLVPADGETLADRLGDADGLVATARLGLDPRFASATTTAELATISETPTTSATFCV